MGLSRLPAAHTNRWCWWAYGIQEKGASSGEMAREEAYFEDEWVGLGFGTGGEERVLKVTEESG